MAEDDAKSAGTTQAGATATAGATAAAPETGKSAAPSPSSPADLSAIKSDAPEKAEMGAEAKPSTPPKIPERDKSLERSKSLVKVQAPAKADDTTPDAAPKSAPAKPGRWKAFRAVLALAAPTADATDAAAKTEPAFAALPATQQPDKSADDEKPAGKPAGTLFGSLDADERLRQEAERNERLLWAGAVAATLIYASLIAGQTMTGFAAPIPLDQQEKERRGQDGPPDSISVELVPEPDKNAKTKRWQDGSEVPAPQPSEQMPQPPQQPQTQSLEQPELKQAVKPDEEEEKEKEAEEEKSGDPTLLDLESLAEAAAADFSRQVDRAFSKKQRRQEERQAVYSSGAMKVRGRGASGKSDEFSRSVIAALMKTRPGPVAIWGRVLVSFELSPSGTLNYVRVLDSSGNTALDQAAVNAIHKARFKAPPPGLSAQERTYIIDYIFG
jgi:TonB family protein